jgi:methyl-accepting chemotaxis protein
MIQTFRDLKIGVKIFGGFSIVLLLMVIVAFSGFKGLTGVVNRAGNKDDVGKLTQSFYKAKQHEKNYIMRNDNSYADKLKQEISVLEDQAKRLKSVFDDQQAKKYMDHVSNAATNYENAFDQFSKLRNQKTQRMQEMRQKAKTVRTNCNEFEKKQVAHLKKMRDDNAIYIKNKMARADDANMLVKMALNARHYRALIMQGNFTVIDEWKSINKEVYQLLQSMKTHFNSSHNIKETEAIIVKYKHYENTISSFVSNYQKRINQIDAKSIAALKAIQNLQKQQQQLLDQIISRSQNSYSLPNQVNQQTNQSVIVDRLKKFSETNRLLEFAYAAKSMRQSILRGELDKIDAWKADNENIIKQTMSIQKSFRNHSNVSLTKNIIRTCQAYEAEALEFIKFYKDAHQIMTNAAVVVMEQIEKVHDDQAKQLKLAQDEFEIKLENKLSLVSNANLIVKVFVDARKNEKEVIITGGEKKYLDFVNKGIKQVLTIADTMKSHLTATDDIESIDAVISATKAYFDTFNDYVDLTEKQNVSETNMLKSALFAQKKCQEALENQEQQMNDNVYATNVMNIIIVLIAIVLGLLISFAITKGVLRPIVKSLDFTRMMAEGDFSTNLDIDQKDEMGDLAKALNEMLQKVNAMIREIAGGVDTVSSSSTELSSVSDHLAENAQKTSDLSSNVATSADEMSANMNSVAAAVEETSANVATVASAAEEMTATINEISKNTEKAHKITDEAVIKSKEASDRVNQLGDNAKEIGTVTQTITEISEQTNLLALNATIESARAGEAGKGFAVVANEIKELARQTSRSTEEIRSKIDAIQRSTSISVDEIMEITNIIQEVNDIVGTIAVAMGEQSTATQEIASNVSQASVGTSEVSSNVSQTTVVAEGIAKDVSSVNSAAKDVSQDSHQVQQSAMNLSELAEKLNTQIRKFKV